MPISKGKKRLATVVLVIYFAFIAAFIVKTRTFEAPENRATHVRALIAASQKHAGELAQMRAEVAEMKTALAAHAEATGAKLSDLFQVLEALPEILESQGSKLGQLLEWSEDEQEKSPIRQIQRLGKLIGDRRRGTDEGEDASQE